MTLNLNGKELPIIQSVNTDTKSPNYNFENKEGKKLDTLNEVFRYIVGSIYKNIDNEKYQSLKKEFDSFNDSTKYKLLDGLVSKSGNDINLSKTFYELVEADEKIYKWGSDNGYKENPRWKELLEELGVIQLQSLVKYNYNYNVEELFKLVTDKIRALNKIIEIDRNIVPNGSNRSLEQKYLKYKQKYLKLKNNN